MKLVLIGHSVEDHIYYNDKESIGPGGLFYSAAGMLGVKNEEDEIILLTSIETGNYHLFSKIYDRTNTSYCNRGVNIVPKVHLKIYDEREREESYENLGSNLDIIQRFPFKPDGILINMITGFDINPEQLSQLRKNNDCPIYMDVHSLTRGSDASLNRPQQLMQDFANWSVNLDIIQANEIEVFSLFDLQVEREIVEELFSAGVKILIVTKGNKGARVYYKHRNEIVSAFVSAEKVKTENQVGLGDIFGAVYFYSYLKSKNVTGSLAIANKAAGMAAAYQNTDDFVKLMHDVLA